MNVTQYLTEKPKGFLPRGSVEVSKEEVTIWKMEDGLSVSFKSHLTLRSFSYVIPKDSSDNIFWTSDPQGRPKAPSVFKLIA
jgi:hypothetical protein